MDTTDKLKNIVNAIDEMLNNNRPQGLHMIQTINTQAYDILNLVVLTSIELNKCNVLNEILKNTPFLANYEIDVGFGKMSLLLKAIAHKSIECTRVLIENGADVNKPSNILGIQYPIESATRNELIEIVKLLVDYDVNITYQSVVNCLNTPEILSLLIQKDSQHVVQLRNNRNETVLHYYDLTTGFVRQILDAGYDITSVDNNGNTALHKIKHLNILQLLVERGFNLEARNNDGETPVLSQISLARPEENILFLLQAGANSLIESNDGRDIFLYSVFHGYLEVFTYMLAQNVNINKVYQAEVERITVLDIVNQFMEAIENNDDRTEIYSTMRTQLLNRGAISAQDHLVQNGPALNENTYRQLPYLHVGKNNTNSISMNTFQNDNIVGILPTYKSNNVTRQHRIYKKNHAFKMYNKNTRRLTNTGKYILNTRRSPITRNNIEPENIRLYRARVRNTNALNYGPVGSANIEFEPVPNKMNAVRPAEPVGPNVVECKGKSCFPGFKGLFSRKSKKVAPIGGKKFRRTQVRRRR